MALSTIALLQLTTILSMTVLSSGIVQLIIDDLGTLRHKLYLLFSESQKSQGNLSPVFTGTLAEHIILTSQLQGECSYLSTEMMQILSLLGLQDSGERPNLKNKQTDKQANKKANQPINKKVKKSKIKQGSKTNSHMYLHYLVLG